ncbi:hypothetical protein BGX21_005353 [Mortierella sp. AD011]|nr:hypothetical protein BGX20_004836 [Mortierella sp. AD010]KAF9370926.1 hypothetical protein BGX21_005353 [Mortierella sp. AD011]
MGSEETIIILDAYGLTAKIYGMSVFDDICGCSEPLGKICLPTNKYEMETLLEGESMEFLSRYKEHVDDIEEMNRAHAVTARLLYQMDFDSGDQEFESGEQESNQDQ